MSIFLMDFAAELYVEKRYGFCHEHPDIENIVTSQANLNGDSAVQYPQSHQHLHSGDQNSQRKLAVVGSYDKSKLATNEDDVEKASIISPKLEERSFQQQIAAFLILEFGVIFHSVIIGLNLGTVGSEFSTLYPVLVFHQSFEGLGIGARMSAIPFPERFRWMPWVLCAGYGLTTPISIAIGLGLRTTYNSGSFTANVVSGVLDAISAGILIYTGLVELLARDFLYNPERTRDSKRLTFMVACVFVGAGVMALLGKWA
jgi:zinc transporter 1/2/3